MKKLFLALFLVLAGFASLALPGRAAAKACVDSCSDPQPVVVAPFQCDYSWTYEAGYVSKGDLRCGKWFSIPNAKFMPGLERYDGTYSWIPNICSVGAGYDESAGKWYLIGMCDDVPDQGSMLGILAPIGFFLFKRMKKVLEDKTKCGYITRYYAEQVVRKSGASKFYIMLAKVADVLAGGKEMTRAERLEYYQHKPRRSPLFSDKLIFDTAEHEEQARSYTLSVSFNGQYRVYVCPKCGCATGDTSDLYHGNCFNCGVPVEVVWQNADPLAAFEF